MFCKLLGVLSLARLCTAEGISSSRRTPREVLPFEVFDQTKESLLKSVNRLRGGLPSAIHPKIERMSEISSKRIARLAAGGAIGGFASFLALNPGMTQREIHGQATENLALLLSETFSQAIVFGTAIGLAIGACLIVAEEIESGRLSRLLLRVVPGAVVGAAFGAAGGLIGQLSFSVLLLINLIVARTVGWCLLGVAAGICPGTISRSAVRVRQGALGGAIGGGAGGLLFDLIGLFTGTGSASRAVGLILLGAAVGVAVGLVEEFKKEYWVTLLTGAREGRSYILAKSETTLGRDELADIPLFGDFGVQKNHAQLLRAAAGVRLQAARGCVLAVNLQPGTAFTLADGDTLTVGKHRLRFHSRHGAQTSGETRLAAGSAPLQSPSVSQLTVVSGPHRGETFQLDSGVCIIGRDPAAGISLSRDGLVSREHARIVRDGYGCRLDDLGSTNGLYVNGERVSVHWLHPGDQVGLGHTVLTAV